MTLHAAYHDSACCIGGAHARFPSHGICAPAEAAAISCWLADGAGSPTRRTLSQTCLRQAAPPFCIKTHSCTLAPCLKAAASACAPSISMRGMNGARDRPRHQQHGGCSDESFAHHLRYLISQSGCNSCMSAAECTLCFVNSCVWSSVNTYSPNRACHCNQACSISALSPSVPHAVS